MYRRQELDQARNEAARVNRLRELRPRRREHTQTLNMCHRYRLHVF